MRNYNDIHIMVREKVGVKIYTGHSPGTFNITMLNFSIEK